MNADDPLIPAPSTDGWFPPAGNGEDALERGYANALDYFSFNAIAWPAKNAAGDLVAPPDEHVLDYLARAHDLVDEETAAVRPSASTVAVVSTLHFCNLCDDPDVRARYDARLTVKDVTATGFACERCYDACGGGILGASGDTYLLTLHEVSQAVRDVCNELTTRLDRPSLWP